MLYIRIFMIPKSLSFSPLGIAVTLAALTLLPLCLLKKSIRSFQWLSNIAVFLIVTATITAAVSVAARSPSEIGASDITAWLLPTAQKKVKIFLML